MTSGPDDFWETVSTVIIYLTHKALAAMINLGVTGRGKTKSLNEKRQCAPSPSESLDAPVVKMVRRRPPKRSRAQAELQCDVIPLDGQTEPQFFAEKVFAPLEAEDLQCKVLDDDGICVPFTLRNDITFLR